MKAGLKVTVHLSTPIKGVVVGFSQGLVRLWIIECTDGTLPNEVYPYKVFVCPEGVLGYE